MKTYKFRLYPSKQVEQKMLDTLELCRQTYNVLLGELQQQEIIDKSQIQGIIPDIKIADHSFQKLHSKTMQYECYRLFSNLRALAQTKGKRKNGALRFKGKGWFKTFTYNQSGFKLVETGKRFDILNLSKIGDIQIRCHRSIKGVIKQITVKKEQSGKWFAFIATNEGKTILQQPIKKVIGIDVGLDYLVYDSDGNAVRNPRHLRKNEQKLVHLQRSLSRKRKGSNNRAKWRIRVAKQHEKISDIRNDFIHKLSYFYTKEYDVIGMENMPMTVKNDWMAKSKLDASWGKLRQFVTYKAENAGKLCIQVPYRGTTQRCSQCGNEVKKELKDRIHDCQYCGFKVPRDYNSALEIKRLTLLKLGLPQELRKVTLVEIPLTAELQCRSTSYVLEKQEALCESIW